MKNYKKIRLMKWQTVTGFLTTLVLVVCLLGALRPEGVSDAADAEISETEEISTVKGNGPGKVTNLKELGINKVSAIRGKYPRMAIR